MKRLLVLTLLAVLTATAPGCGCVRNWLNRGAACGTCAPGADAGHVDPYLAPPTVSPGGAMYLPGPG